MTTLEKTISMVKTLPEAKQIQLQKIISKWQRQSDPFFSEITVEQLRQDLQEAEKQIKRGECMEMGQALEMIRNKHGL